MRSIIILLGVVLTGCSAMQPVQVQTIKVPVAINCIKNAPNDPLYTYPTIPAGQSKQQALALVADLELAKQYGRDWKASAAGCMSLPSKLSAP